MVHENKVKYLFLGATKYSEELLLHLIKHDFLPQAIFAIPEKFLIKYRKDGIVRKMRNYNYANLKEIAESYNIPYFEVDGSEGKKIGDYLETIKSFSPDLILVLGWYYLVPKKIREVAPLGAWGIHASLLPKYAGGAPLVWAIINGEKEAGVTLFRFDDSVDGGDIIKQKKFPILFEDTIKEVYEKAIKASKEILVEVFTNLDKVTFTPQNKSKIEIWPQRFPEDGEIDWNKGVIEVYNFIRAQTKPYPGAFTFLKGKKLIIWSAYPIKEVFISTPKRIVKYKNKSGVQLADGLLIISEVNYDGREGDFNSIAEAYKCWGGRSGSRIFKHFAFCIEKIEKIQC